LSSPSITLIALRFSGLAFLRVAMLFARHPIRVAIVNRSCLGAMPGTPLGGADRRAPRAT